MRSLTPKESNIEEQICFYLETLGISCNKINSEGFYNQKKGIYQKRKSNYSHPGISDIIGSIPPLGRALYIEVKRPDEMELADRPSSVQEQELIEAQYHRKLKKGSVEKYQHRWDQSKFIEEKLMTGAVAFFASSPEEVRAKLLNFGI